jgi:hypothetical protein
MREMVKLISAKLGMDLWKKLRASGTCSGCLLTTRKKQWRHWVHGQCSPQWEVMWDASIIDDTNQ